VEALREVSFQVRRGEFVSIIGPSGCGKSTLLEIIGGLKSKTAGRILLKGREINGIDPSVKIVFQEDTTLPWRTALGNVELGLEVRGIPKEERRERCLEMIRLVGLSGFEDSYPGELSGGMRQRVAIARTLVLKPEILLMDEPFGALDEQTRLLLGDELLSIWSRLGQTILFITHSISEAVLLSDRVIVMSNRPGTIKDNVEIGIERPRRLGEERVSRLVQRIWEMLRGEVREER
jgi:NitT/TauT family transport system ATP-binding protein